METTNLNLARIPDDRGWGSPGTPLDNHGIKVCRAEVEVLFRDLELELISRVKFHQAVVGCVAWLTSMPILAALAEKDHASIVVQKEDFLRPDVDARGDWKRKLRAAYAAIGSKNLERHELDGVAGSLNLSHEPRVDGVRCVGNFNRDKRPASPRMHNKFLIFGDIEFNDPRFQDEEDLRRFVPRSVWTGSFNFTANATMSLENAVVVHHEDAAAAYYAEWAQIFALSEPLDWQHDWLAPEYRIGT